jgi:mannitol/fructose-specific phosphotransferase system IIA component (Ntr-type)
MLAAASITALLPSSQILAPVQAPKRTAAIHEVARLLQTHPNVANFQGFYNDLLARDRLDTTCVGNGIAMPHARTEHVRHLVLALGISKEGVPFENSNQRIHLLFVIGTPKSMAADYLATVSMLCRLLREEGNRQRLIAAVDALAAHEVLRELEG